MRPVDLAIRLEWWAVAAAAVAGYAFADGSWWLFAALLLAPDLSMLGYLGGPRLGALAYNAFHILVAPVLLLAVGVYASGGTPVSGNLLLHVALIWIVHIAIDRALGYGLKLPTGFQDTHLGRIGRG